MREGRQHLGSSTFWARAAGSFVFRLVAYDAMLFMALIAESRPAPTLPDPLVAWVPFVEAANRYNYVLWLFAYVPIALALLWRDGDRFIRYMITSGLLALVRGVCILATGLGPVHGPDVHAGMTAAERWDAFLSLITPFGFFAGAPVALTKDLFFSGHTATTFLLLLYVWRWKDLRWLMLAAHVAVVACVFLAHLHYTIDVIGAYAVTFSIFVLRERDVRSLV